MLYPMATHSLTQKHDSELLCRVFLVVFLFFFSLKPEVETIISIVFLLRDRKAVSCRNVGKMQ